MQVDLRRRHRHVTEQRRDLVQAPAGIRKVRPERMAEPMRPLRLVFVLKGEAGKEALDRWIAWAQRCRIPSFVALQRRIRKHRAATDATLDHGLSQGLVESTNTKIRVLTRFAYGFKFPEALIALAMLALGGHRPSLPGRARTDPRINQEEPEIGSEVWVRSRSWGRSGLLRAAGGRPWRPGGG